MIVPTLLFLLILLVLVAIIGVSINQERRRRRMQREVRKMKKMAAAVSNVSLVGEAMQEKEEVKPVKGKAKKKESGDKTIYDDRKKLNSWQVHLSDTYKAMKKKNPKTTFQAAMKAAKKTYKKAKK